MPVAAIEICRSYSRDEEAALIDAVQGAMVESLQVPIWTTALRLFVHEPHRFVKPHDKSDRYMLVSIDCFIGCSVETKRALYLALVRRLGVCGIPGDHLKVLLREAPRENWGIRGGMLASEVALEYSVDR